MKVFIKRKVLWKHRFSVFFTILRIQLLTCWITLVALVFYAECRSFRNECIILPPDSLQIVSHAHFRAGNCVCACVCACVCVCVCVRQSRTVDRCTIKKKVVGGETRSRIWTRDRREEQRATQETQRPIYKDMYLPIYLFIYIHIYIYTVQTFHIQSALLKVSSVLLLWVTLSYSNELLTLSYSNELLTILL